MRTELVECDAARATFPDLVTDEVNLHCPDRPRGLPKVAAECVDGNLGNQRRGETTARVHNVPENTPFTHESANGFRQGAFGRNEKARVGVLLVTILRGSVGEGSMLKKRRNGDAI